MSEAMHPSTLGEILDRTVQLYRTRFLVFLGLAALPAGVVLVFAGGMVLLFAWAGTAGAQFHNPTLVGVVALIGLGIFLLIGLPLMLVVSALGSAAMTQAADKAQAEEAVTIRGVVQAAWQRGWSYLWLYFMETVFVWAVPITAYIVLVAVIAGGAALTGGGGSADAGFFVGLLFVAAIIALAGYCIWMLLRLSLAFPVCVVERTSAWAAIKRSIQLSKGTRGRIVVVYLLGMVLNWIFSMAAVLLVTIGVTLTPAARSLQNSQTLGVVMICAVYGSGFIVQMLTKPVYGIALVLFYYDQRIRHEGYDIEWMMQRAGLVVEEPQASTAVPWLPATPLAAAATGAETMAAEVLQSDDTTRAVNGESE